jgi:hypothetical protein
MKARDKESAYGRIGHTLPYSSPVLRPSAKRRGSNPADPIGNDAASSINTGEFFSKIASITFSAAILASGRAFQA